MKRCLIPIAVLSNLLCWSLIACADDHDKLREVQFSRDVLPILSDRCFHCHGPDAQHREADLRLDLRESTVDDLSVVVPGSPDKSELLTRITSPDPDHQMPPTNSHRKPLSTDEVQILRQWIAEGAVWGKHWAFEKPVRPTVEAGLHPIDALIRQRLTQAGLTHSSAADRRTLIRRVTLDLIGLPPSVEEVEAFLADESPDAYERLLDRLFASEHYGERMAWPWLDAARYADTSGFQGDPERSMWPWRDWVVKALNDNMPFDQFTIEQLAGDLLESPTPEQRLATGFNRNHMHNGEGGRIAEETRIENVFDRTETTGTVWLGLTLQCARCHDHKFDPTSNEDYFAFFDFFNQTSESGRGDGSLAVPPSMDYLAQDRRAQLDAAAKLAASLKSQWTAASEEADAAQAAWESQLSEVPEPIFVPALVKSASSTGGATITVNEDAVIHATGARPEKDIYEIIATSSVWPITAIRLEALVDPESPAKSTGRDENGNFVLSEFELFVGSPDGQPGDRSQIQFASASATHEQGDLRVEKAIDGKTDAANGWAPGAHTHKEASQATFVIADPSVFQEDTALTFRLRFESQHTHHTLAKFRLLVTASKQPNSVDASVKDILAKPRGERSPQEQTQLREHFLIHHWPESANLVRQWETAQAELRKLENASKPTRVMIMDTISEPRETLILVKGVYNNATDQKVQANVPGMLPPLPAKPDDARYTRLDLAHWLVSPENPLTARVVVNRYWQLFFGRGLVSTPSDFGLQGAQPTHPDLLDWLAIEFIESGWDVKRLHRLIVTSDTYRQSAHATKEMLERDPQNELLARATRYRMPSWMIRDASLAAAGLLHDRLGGKPVKSYQPDGIWAEATFGKIKYQVDEGESLYRRSIYSFWRRIVGPTVFFDAAKRQTCEVQPNLTNTPLHALTTLNDVTFVEAARVMAGD
ncbi:MAG: PSD1 and planctomycete cytochrome C domain-containing protein [Pirellulaceae bacterium]